MILHNCFCEVKKVPFIALVSYNAHPPSHVAFFEKYRQHFENICFD